MRTRHGCGGRRDRRTGVAARRAAAIAARVAVLLVLHPAEDAVAAAGACDPAAEDVAVAADGAGAVEIRLLSDDPHATAGLLLSLVAADDEAPVRRGRSGISGLLRCGGLRPGTYGVFLGDGSSPGARLGEVRVEAGRTRRALFRPAAAGLVERVIVPGAPADDGRTGPSHGRFTRAEIEDTPAAFGDPMRAVSGAAGLAVPGDLRSELRIRGGDPADTAVLIDGLPVPHPYHFAGGAGSVTTVDAGLLSEVSVQAGGFSAEHGDALAGVIDFVTRDAPPGGHRGEAGASTLAARAAFTGPAGRGSYLASARASDLGLYRERVESDVREVALHDLNAALRLPLGDAARLELGGTATGHRFEQDLGGLETGVMDGRGRAFRLRLHRPFGSGALLRLQAGVGTLTVRTTAGGGLRQDEDLSRQDLRITVHADAGGRHRLSAGLSLSRTRGTMRGSVPDGDTLVESAVDRDDAVRGLFVEDRMVLGERVVARLGVRADRGPGSARAHASPRLAVDVAAAPGLTLRAAAGRFVQFPRLEQVFLAAGDPLRPQAADHLVVGIDVTRFAGVRVVLEGYRKDIRDPIGESVNRFVEFPERLARFDAGRIRGFDLTIAGEGERGWRWRLVYGRLRAVLERDGTRSSSNSEQRHAASAGLTRRFGAGWEAGATLRIAAGLPYTPQEPVLDGSSYVPALGALNAARLPSTARLDLRLARALRAQRGTILVHLDVLNATGRDNVRSVDLEHDEGSGAFYRVTGYQTPLTPVAGFSAEF
jgi:hypothetical protein